MQNKSGAYYDIIKIVSADRYNNAIGIVANVIWVSVIVTKTSSSQQRASNSDSLIARRGRQPLYRHHKHPQLMMMMMTMTMNQNYLWFRSIESSLRVDSAINLDRFKQ